jgi:hypothetical protein
VQFVFICDRVYSVRKTAEWPFCVFIGYCIVYCGVGII